MTDWTATYVGIPFAPHGRGGGSVDCYGLVAEVYRAELGIALPTYTDDYAEVLDRHQVAALIAREKAAWLKVDTVVDSPRAFDVVLLRALGAVWHVGVVVESGLMLHVLKGIDSCLERYDGLHWGRRVVGFYRYVTPP